MEKDYSIKEEWADYYNELEDIRQSGITNMFGAAPYLAMAFNISEEFASTVLVNWMHNYNELSKKYGWRD